MAPAIPTSSCSSEERYHEDSDEGSPVSSPRECQCGNQLAHFDWAGRPYPNLPECCRPAVGYIPHIAVDGGKIPVQQYIYYNIYTHTVLQQKTMEVRLPSLTLWRTVSEIV